ncbi:MAG: hypothetical protein PHW13_10260 [Methylococcales bacterium]|nr:hypothetical protein [Methylococcales bacterium]
MHLANTFYPLPRRALAAAVLGLLVSGNALADYTWSVPTTTFDTDNASNANGSSSEFVGINNAGTIAGDFSYRSAAGVISGLASGDYYGFVGTSGVTSNSGYSGIYNPGGLSLTYGTGTPYQNNGVTGINNNGYLTFSLANSTGITSGSYVGNSTSSPAGGVVIADTNSYAGGDTSLTSTENISSTYAQGLSSGSAGSYGVVVGTLAILGGNSSQAAFIYNNTGATLAGIANGGYGDFNFDGLSGAAAQANGNDFTGFTGAADHGGDVYVSGYYQDGTADTFGLVFNATTGNWMTVTDPNAGAVGSGYDVTVVTGLNNVGEAVGYYSDSNGVFHGFTYDYLTNLFTNAQLDYAGTIGGEAVTSTVIYGVNDSGTLVGQVQTNTLYAGVGFQAVSSVSAVPVPAAFWMMLSGLVAGQGLLRKPRFGKRGA